MDTPASGSPSRPLPGRTDAPAWPALAALFTAGLLPATTARRTVRVKLDSAFIVHLLAAGATVLTIALLAAWAGISGPATCSAVWEQFLEHLGSLINKFQHAPSLNAVFLLSAVLSIETGYLLLVLLCTPGGAIDEPVRSSIRSAIQRAWLHTPHLLLVILLCGAAMVQLMRVHRAADLRADKLAFEEIRTAGRASSQEEVQAAFARYHELSARQPLHVRYAEELLLPLWVIGGAWWLWALLRFIGVHRTRVPTARAPTCEACGYNLTGIPLEGRCPECGDPIASSLGAGARPGPPWQHRRTIGAWRAWRSSLTGALTRPTWFGRQLRVSEPTSAHRWFLATCLPAVFLIAWIGLVACWVAQGGNNPFTNEGLARAVVFRDGSLTAVFSSLGVLVIALGTAWLIGVVYGGRFHRNLMPASMQAACYLGGYLTAWTAFAFFWTAVLFYSKNVINRIGQGFSTPREFVWFAVIGFPNLLALGGYVYLVARVTAAARHANR